MGIITNKIYIYTSSEKNVVDNIDWDGLSTEEYNSKTYYKISSGGSSSDVVKKITFETFKDNVTVTLNIVSSSEQSFDFAYACDLDGTSGYSNAKYKISGYNKSITCEYVVPTKGSHWIYIGYRKDSSGNSYNDCGYFNIDLPEEKLYVSEFKQPNKVYLASNKMKEITYGDKKILEYSNKDNIIKWTCVNQSYSPIDGKIGISYSYINKKVNKSFNGVAYCSDSSFLKSLIDNEDNNIAYIRFNADSNISWKSNVLGTTYTYTYTIDLSDIDFSSIKDVSNMFYGWKSLKEVKLPKDFAINKTNLSYLFDGYDNYYRFDYGNVIDSIDFNGFDTSSVTNMSNMFGGCRKLTYLDLSSFDTSNVTNMRYMFSNGLDYYGSTNGMDNLTSINISNFNTSKVTDMTGMFGGCRKLTSLDLSSFDTSNVTAITRMFERCQSLTSLDLSNFNTSKVEWMVKTFYGTTNLFNSDGVLDLSNFDVRNVKSFNSMFYGCGAKVIDLSNWHIKENAITDGMFGGAWTEKIIMKNCSRSTIDKITSLKPKDCIIVTE